MKGHLNCGERYQHYVAFNNDGRQVFHLVHVIVLVRVARLSYTECCEGTMKDWKLAKNINTIE